MVFINQFVKSCDMKVNILFFFCKILGIFSWWNKTTKLNDFNSLKRIAESVSRIWSESTTDSLNAFPTVIRFCSTCVHKLVFLNTNLIVRITHTTLINTRKKIYKYITCGQEMRVRKNGSVLYWSRDPQLPVTWLRWFEHGRQRGAPESLRWRWGRWGVSAPEPAVWPEASASPDPGAGLHVLSGLR